MGAKKTGANAWIAWILAYSDNEKEQRHTFLEANSGDESSREDSELR